MKTLVANQINKSYPTPSEPLAVLREVDFSLESGEGLAVVGPSGSGKSTLLSILGALEPPTSGFVELDGTRPFDLPESRLPAFRARYIGFVFQEHYLLPQCTVLENVLTPILAERAAVDEDHRQARGILDRVGLSDRLTHRPSELSGGERQRTAIARALIRDPKLILADEPTGALDRATAMQVAQLLAELQRERRAILIVATHNETLAETLQRRMRLEEGRLGDA